MMRRPIVLVAHNIRSLWNVGAFFRSADAFGVEHVYLTGYTAAPPRAEIAKTALGADSWIPWTKVSDPLPLLSSLKKSGFRIVALEIAEGSVRIQDDTTDAPTCIVLGHEIQGVPAEIRAACDAIVHIPMLGKKHSLNVSVAAGIAMYHYRSGG